MITKKEEFVGFGISLFVIIIFVCAFYPGCAPLY